MGKKSFDASILIRNLTKQVTDYGKLQGERSRIQSELLSNQIKGSQNWFWKMKEKNYQTPYQKNLGEQFQRQGQGGGGEIKPFEETPQPRVVQGAKGYGVKTPQPKEYIYQRIQEKRKRKMTLTKSERQFEEKYLGIKGRGDPAYFNQAKQRAPGYFSTAYSDDPKKKEDTLKVISNIQTMDDIQELRDNQTEYENAGVDVTAILEFYDNI